MKIKEANSITGGLSNPSKMPGRAYSIPASRCNVGSKLAKRLGCQTSEVRDDGNFTCPSSSTDNECRDCRACWEDGNVIYKKH